MDRLPDEILHKIFIQTSLMQKQECMFVCRQWANIIRTRSLFRTVQIRDEALYISFIDLIERVPSLGRQVEYLVLFKCLKDDFDKRKLLRLFPNLREIKMRGEKRARSVDTHTIAKKRFELTSFRSQMECIVDYDECELTRLLAISGLCSRLTTLTLNLNLTTSSRTDIFSDLKDMPLLKKLTLENSPITMENCETLHANLPSIEQLVLIKVGFVPSQLPEDIKPAASVTSLYVKMRDLKLHRHVDWPLYIFKKYTRLIHFRYTIPNYGFHSRYLKNFHEIGYLPLIKSLGPQLKTISFMGVDTDVSVLSKLDEFKCRIREFMFTAKELSKGLDILTQTKQAGYIQQLTVMRMSPAPFDWLKKMRKLRSLDLYYLEPENFIDPARTEDADFIKMVTVDLNGLFECCPKTVESMFIQKAYLAFDIHHDVENSNNGNDNNGNDNNDNDNNDNGNVDVNDNDNDNDNDNNESKECTESKDATDSVGDKSDNSKSDVNTNHNTSNSNNGNNNSNTKNKNKNKIEFPNLKRLKLDQVKLITGIDMFISNHFPHLHSLTLNDCLDKSAILNFPKHRFSYFEISTSSDNINISLNISKSNTKPHFYSTSCKRCRIGYSELATYLSPVTRDDLGEEEYIKLTCRSIKILTLNGLRAYLTTAGYEYKSF